MLAAIRKHDAGREPGDTLPASLPEASSDEGGDEDVRAVRSRYFGKRGRVVRKLYYQPAQHVLKLLLGSEFSIRSLELFVELFPF